MDYFQAFILSLVQGITEFLPISSSAHLILVPKLFNWEEHGLAFDVAVHFGTLLAVCFYFRKEVYAMLCEWLKSPKINAQNKDSYLVWKVIVATCPIVICGFIFKDLVDYIRTPMMIAFGMIFFGLILWHADRYVDKYEGKHNTALKNEYDMSLKSAFIIGISQVLAIIPGTSRSGITMTAAMYLGITRESAARFSFLLSIPTISLGFIWQSLKAYEQGLDLPIAIMIFSILLSAFFAWITIFFFLKIIQSMKFDLFVAYRILLGLLIIYLFV